MPDFFNLYMIRQLLTHIFRISIPAIIINITTPLLSMSDLAIAGHSGGAALVAAVALGGAMFNMLYWLFGFLRMGASGSTAQAYGRGDMTGCYNVLSRALFLGFAIGILMIILSPLLLGFLLWFMEPDMQTLELAVQYFDICILGAPAVLGSFALTGWLVGMQNSKVPMWISISVNVINILLSVFLVFYCNMGVRGMAVGTTLAQWMGFISTCVACRMIFGFRYPGLKEIFNFTELRRFFKVNADIFLRTVCLVAVTMWFTRVGAMQGAVMLAVNALLMQLFTGFSFFMDGFAFAAEALCGKFEGARQWTRLRVTVRMLLSVGLGMALLFTVVYFVFGTEFLSLLSSDHVIRSSAEEYIGWAISIPMLSFAAFVYDCVAIGAVRTGAMLRSMVIASVVFGVIYLLTYSGYGNHGLWLAFVSYLLVRGVALAVMLRNYWLDSPICSR